MTPSPLSPAVESLTYVKEMENCSVYEGHARFESPHEVSVGDVRITADQIFLNVGARAIVPSIPRLDQVPYLTNSSMMHVDFLPKHLVILGGIRCCRAWHMVHADLPPEL